MNNLRRWTLWAVLSWSAFAGAAEVHGGGSLGVGIAAPFEDANAGFKLGLKGWLEVEATSVLRVGLALPVQFGFYGGASGFVNTSFNTIDILPSLRGAVELTDWVLPYAEFGGGPSILIARVGVPGLGVEQTETRTVGAMRIAAGVEIAPPSLSGFLVDVQAATFNVRFGNTAFSEYAFMLAVGYRR